LGLGGGIAGAVVILGLAFAARMAATYYTSNALYEQAYS
jgi:hypothetical protein